MEDLDPRFSRTVDPEHEQRTCSRKIKYRSKSRAREARDILRRTYSSADHYQCRVCGAWHVSKMKTEDDRTFRRRAATGDLVMITYDVDPGVTLHPGDGLKTATGRTYLIVEATPNRKGPRAGIRYRLFCAVNQPIPGVTYPLVWYSRDSAPAP